MLPAGDPTRTVSPVEPDITKSVADPAVVTGSAANSGSERPSLPSARYTLGEETPRGGRGVVSRATDPALGREVAVKVLQAGYGPAPAAARRFADEARIAAQLQHPA